MFPLKVVRKWNRPNILHREESLIWKESISSGPLFTIHTVSFSKITPLPNHLDLRSEGRSHFWAKEKDELRGALVMCFLTEAGAVKRIEYHHWGGCWVEVNDARKMEKTGEMDDEMFLYCLAGFVENYLRHHYDLKPPFGSVENRGYSLR
jgi:hypothetical protein